MLGAEVGLIDTQGDARLTGVSQRHEYEVAFGGNYKLAPGVQLVGEYMYTHRHQGGFDFATNTLGNARRDRCDRWPDHARCAGPGLRVRHGSYLVSNGYSVSAERRGTTPPFLLYRRGHNGTGPRPQMAIAARTTQG